MNLARWWTSWQRLWPYIVVPLILVVSFWLAVSTDEPSLPVAQAAGPATTQRIGTAGNFTSLYRVEYEGQVYIVVRGHNGAVAITRHEGP